VRPTRRTRAGRAYLDLQNTARREKRPTDELLTLYALEGFLARLSASPHRDALVLKGGVLLAAFDARRPTRDVDLQARALANDLDAVLAVVRDVAATPLPGDLDDGLSFDLASATAQVIRDEEDYPGVRVSLVAGLAPARLTFHVDVNVGDPIRPAPRLIDLPRLLGGTIRLRGYPIAMVHAEKLVTAIARGTANTRWRDFADLHTLSGVHPVPAAQLLEALTAVASHRGVALQPLAVVLDGYPLLGQNRWAAWRRRHRREELPASFADLLASVSAFADPVLRGHVTDATWDPRRRAWA
jgi:hypothetical protein